MKRIAGFAIAGITAILATRWLNREKPLYISMGRVNREFRDNMMPDPEEQAYRDRVKDRIMRGYECKHPPWFVRGPYSKPRFDLVKGLNDKAQAG